jgi:peptidyl-prolyl cis-trans isomerase SurA
MLLYFFKLMKIIKRKSLFSLIIALFLLLPLNLPGEVMERIVALVNSEVITLSELEEAGKPLYDQVRQTSTPSELEGRLKKAREEILERLVESKLLEQEIKKRKIEVPDRDVDSTIQEIMESAHLNENELKKNLAREGMTYSAYRQKVREELGKMRLVNREIKTKIVIEEEAIRKEYQKNLDKFTDPLEVKIQQIFFPLPKDASEEGTAAVRKEAQAVLERARKGEDFTELAKKYSQGPEAAEGGLLGYFKRKELVPELEEAAFRLKPGEITDIVESPLGFHILRVLERKGGEPRPFAEVQYKIREEMVQSEADRKYSEWMKDLKAKAYVEIKL